MESPGKPGHAPISVGPTEIVRVVHNIWATMFQRPIATSARVEPLQDDHWTGCVHINGPWCGTVHVRLTVPLATRLAGIMFAMNEQDLSLEEISDAVGEVANMTGGNLKTLMGYPATLSTPEVALGEAHELLQRRSFRPLYEMTFYTDGDPFVVHIVECGQASQT
jgi:chemotaxis protein CheX